MYFVSNRGIANVLERSQIDTTNEPSSREKKERERGKGKEERGKKSETTTIRSVYSRYKIKSTEAREPESAVHAKPDVWK